MRSQTIDDSFEFWSNKTIFVNVLIKFCKIYSIEGYFDLLIIREYNKNVNIVKYNLSDVPIFLVSHL